MRVEVPDKRPACVISQPALWVARGAYPPPNGRPNNFWGLASGWMIENELNIISIHHNFNCPAQSMQRT